MFNGNRDEEVRTLCAWYRAMKSVAMKGVAVAGLGFACTMGVANDAHAWGTVSHVQSSAWTLGNVESPEVRSLFLDGAVRNAFLWGATFPDSGYWPNGSRFAEAGRVFANAAHRETFVEDALAWIRANDPPPWSSDASRMRAAFVMGAALHGLQDELWESVLLTGVERNDGAARVAIELATDALLVREGAWIARAWPWLPDEILEATLLDSTEPAVERAVVDEATRRFAEMTVHPERGAALAAAQERYIGEVPWMVPRYFDRDAPGSVTSAVRAGARYVDGLHARMTPDASAPPLVLQVWPEAPRRLRGWGADSVESWVVLVFSVGVTSDAIEARLVDDEGAELPVRVRGARGVGREGFGRVVSFEPRVDLTPGARYTLVIEGDVTRVDGTVAAFDRTIEFRVRCEDLEDPACPPIRGGDDVSFDTPPAWTPPVVRDDEELDEAPADEVPGHPDTDEEGDVGHGGADDADAGEDGVDEGEADDVRAGRGGSGCTAAAPMSRASGIGLLGLLGVALAASRRGARRRPERWLTDSGLETTLVFVDQVDLPCFAAYPLLETASGRRRLERWYIDHARLAVDRDLGFILEAPTWRANRDWGAHLGHDDAALDRLNRAAIELMREVRERFGRDAATMLVSGCIGPRGDGYAAGTHLRPSEARDYHAAQVRSFAGAGADLVTAMTMTHIGEATGVALAAREVGMACVISFTVEVDGKLPSGERLQDAIAAVDEASGSWPWWYMINCAHPDHFAQELAGGGPWVARIGGLRANASRCSHAELESSVSLDDGDPVELGTLYRGLVARYPQLRVLGGCCGTDLRHVRAIRDACCEHGDHAAGGGEVPCTKAPAEV